MIQFGSEPCALPQFLSSIHRILSAKLTRVIRTGTLKGTIRAANLGSMDHLQLSRFLNKNDNLKWYFWQALFVHHLKEAFLRLHNRKRHPTRNLKKPHDLKLRKVLLIDKSGNHVYNKRVRPDGFTGVTKQNVESMISNFSSSKN